MNVNGHSTRTYNTDRNSRPSACSTSLATARMKPHSPVGRMVGRTVRGGERSLGPPPGGCAGPCPPRQVRSRRGATTARDAHLQGRRRHPRSRKWPACPRSPAGGGLSQRGRGGSRRPARRRWPVRSRRGGSQSRCSTSRSSPGPERAPARRGAGRDAGGPVGRHALRRRSVRTVQALLLARTAGSRRSGLNVLNMGGDEVAFAAYGLIRLLAGGVLHRTPTGLARGWRWGSARSSPSVVASGLGLRAGVRAGRAAGRPSG